MDYYDLNQYNEIKFVRYGPSYITLSSQSPCAFIEISFLSSCEVPKKLRKKIAPCSENDWANGCVKQIMCYRNPHPICFNIVHASLPPTRDTIITFAKKCPELKKWADKNLQLFCNFSHTSGMRVFENRTDWVPFDTLMKEEKRNDKKDLYTTIYCFAVLKQILDFGVTNARGTTVLINLKEKNYFRGVPESGWPKIINFDQTAVPPQNILDVVFSDSKNYMEMIKKIHSAFPISLHAFDHMIINMTEEKFNSEVCYLLELRKNIETKKPRRVTN